MRLDYFYELGFLAPIKRVMGLSKAIPYALVDQSAANMQVLKVCASRDSNPGRPKSSNHSRIPIQTRMNGNLFQDREHIK